MWGGAVSPPPLAGASAAELQLAARAMAELAGVTAGEGGAAAELAGGAAGEGDGGAGCEVSGRGRRLAGGAQGGGRLAGAAGREAVEDGAGRTSGPQPGAAAGAAYGAQALDTCEWMAAQAAAPAVTAAWGAALSGQAPEDDFDSGEAKLRSLAPDVRSLLPSTGRAEGPGLRLGPAGRALARALARAALGLPSADVEKGTAADGSPASGGSGGEGSASSGGAGDGSGRRRGGGSGEGAEAGEAGSEGEEEGWEEDEEGQKEGEDESSVGEPWPEGEAGEGGEAQAAASAARARDAASALPAAVAATAATGPVAAAAAALEGLVARALLLLRGVQAAERGVQAAMAAAATAAHAQAAEGGAGEGAASAVSRVLELRVRLAAPGEELGGGARRARVAAVATLQVVRREGHGGCAPGGGGWRLGSVPETLREGSVARRRRDHGARAVWLVAPGVVAVAVRAGAVALTGSGGVDGGPSRAAAMAELAGQAPAERAESLLPCRVVATLAGGRGNPGDERLGGAVGEALAGGEE